MDTEKLVLLAESRILADLYKTKLDEMIKAVKSSPDYIDCEVALAAEQEEIQELTEAIKAEAKEEYRKTNNKKLPGVTIKIMTSYVCTDETAARQYALEKDQTLLLVDWKSFSQEAKKLFGTHYEFPFFKEEYAVNAQIKSDLSEFIPANSTH